MFCYFLFFCTILIFESNSFIGVQWRTTGLLFNLVPTLPTMQLIHWVTSLGGIPQIACSFLWSHKILYHTFLFHFSSHVQFYTWTPVCTLKCVNWWRYPLSSFLCDSLVMIFTNQKTSWRVFWSDLCGYLNVILEDYMQPLCLIAQSIQDTMACYSFTQRHTHMYTSHTPWTQCWWVTNGRSSLNTGG